MQPATLAGDVELWAAHIAAHADLSDARLERRFAEILATFAAKPLDSIPHATGSAKAAKGTYRFLQNTRFTAEDLLEPLTSVTAKFCRSIPVVLAVQDTTSLNFTTLRTTTGLGPIGYSTQARGLHLHTTLAVRSDGLPIGLLHQQYWSRPPEKRRNDHQALPIEQKESCKWLDGVTGADEALAHLPAEERPRLLHLMDREGDIHDVLEFLADSRDGGIIRCSSNRRINGPIGYAHDAVTAAPLLGPTTFEVPAQAGSKARKATLDVRSLGVTITPTRKHASQSERADVALTLVEVRERDAPAGVEPLHWRLWTTEPAATLKEALEVVRLYRLRWMIEEFHLALKSGCKAEALGLECFERLEKALVCYSAVAVRILSLRDLARREPQTPCTALLSEDAWKALWLHVYQRRWQIPEAIPTVSEVVRWVGGLGGHLGRKRDGLPGVRTLWRGWRDLTILVQGYRLGLRSG